MNKPLRLSASLFLVLLSGCAVKGDYSCGVPANGVRCQPMSETYSQLNDGSLSSLNSDPFPAEDKSGDYEADDADAFAGDSPDTPAAVPATAAPDARSVLPSIATVQGAVAILSAPREMRIWFDRFTDPDGDLHDESFVFIRLDNGHWVIDDKPVLY